MLLWIEEQLDRLPSHEALRCQSWCGRRSIWIFLGLKSVEAAEGLVDEGEGGL